ncbi:MAG: hypothetical protein V7752_08180 [Halopseudomonas sp.]
MITDIVQEKETEVEVLMSRVENYSVEPKGNIAPDIYGTLVLCVPIALVVKWVSVYDFLSSYLACFAIGMILVFIAEHNRKKDVKKKKARREELRTQLEKDRIELAKLKRQVGDRTIL